MSRDRTSILTKTLKDGKTYCGELCLSSFCSFGYCPPLNMAQRLVHFDHRVGASMTGIASGWAFHGLGVLGYRWSTTQAAFPQWSLHYALSAQSLMYTAHSTVPHPALLGGTYLLILALQLSDTVFDLRAFVGRLFWPSRVLGRHDQSPLTSDITAVRLLAYGLF